MHNIRVLAAITLALLSLLDFCVRSSPLPQESADGNALSMVESLLHPNDWDCQPSSDRPRPLILVHGLIGNVMNHLPFMISFFRSQGYCVFAQDHGGLNSVPFVYGLDKMENSAQQLSDFTAKVLKATGASKVDLLSYSAGSLVCQYYMKRLHGGLSVEKHAAIGPVQRGTTLSGLVTLAETLGLLDPVMKALDPICASCFQARLNSTFIRDLYADGDVVPGVQYLLIVTMTDEIVTPYTNGYLRGPSPNVRNQLLQDWCPNDMSDHAVVRADVNVFNGIDAFLTSSGRAVECRFPSLWIPPSL